MTDPDDTAEFMARLYREHGAHQALAEDDPSLLPAGMTMDDAWRLVYGEPDVIVGLGDGWIVRIEDLTAEELAAVMASPDDPPRPMEDREGSRPQDRESVESVGGRRSKAAFRGR